MVMFATLLLKKLLMIGCSQAVSRMSGMLNKKRRICNQAGIRLIEIYPSVLFSKDFRLCLRRVKKQLVE